MSPGGGGGGGGGGGTLISHYHIRRLGPFFWVQNSEFQFVFFLGGGGGVLEKIIFLGGMKILWIFWGVITKLASLRVISMLFGVFFLRSIMYRIGIFFRLLKFQIFFGGA